jgi:DNA-binding XRE family transcriptional regulator
MAEGDPMTPDQYRALRERIGSQADAAEALGVDRMTISRRERGVLPIDREAEMAIRHVAECMD